MGFELKISISRNSGHFHIHTYNIQQLPKRYILGPKSVKKNVKAHIDTWLNIYNSCKTRTSYFKGNRNHTDIPKTHCVFFFNYNYKTCLTAYVYVSKNSTCIINFQKIEILQKVRSMSKNIIFNFKYYF